MCTVILKISPRIINLSKIDATKVRLDVFLKSLNCKPKIFRGIEMTPRQDENINEPSVNVAAMKAKSKAR